MGYFGKQKKKESTEIKEHEQETYSSRPTCSTSASQRQSLTLQKDV